MLNQITNVSRSVIYSIIIVLLLVVLSICGVYSLVLNAEMFHLVNSIGHAYDIQAPVVETVECCFTLGHNLLMVGATASMMLFMCFACDLLFSE